MMAVFNMQAPVSALALGDGRRCVVVDDALLEPERMLRYALDNERAFAPAASSYYPGVLLPVPELVIADLGRFFQLRVRRHFDARRLLTLDGRLSMATQAPHELEPLQTLCHRDRPLLEANASIQACILYLFADSSLGGTSFYAPRRSELETQRLFADARELPRAQFFERYALEQAYPSGSTDWFAHVGRVEARWNRCIFFDGFAFHSGDIPFPERLSADPRRGRLTFNAFFTSSRHLEAPSVFTRQGKTDA